MKEKVQTFKYSLSPSVTPYLSEAQQVAIPLIDELICSLFPSEHFLEPFSHFEDILKAKPIVSKLPPRASVQDLFFAKLADKQSGSSARPKNLQPISQQSTSQSTQVSALRECIEQHTKDADLT